MLHYIGPELRKGIHKYKYSGEDHSLVSKYVLGPYWNWLITWFPLWIAPNTITLSGLLLVLANVVSLLWRDWGLDHITATRVQFLSENQGSLPVIPILSNYGLPTGLDATKSSSFASVLPPYFFVIWAFSLFMYQSLDSIDGKQARRTGMAGPLGELFDHGCDALNTTLENFLATTALGMGRSYWSILSLIASTANFYLSTWEEVHTHSLYLSAFSGPVEGILMLCGVYVVAGIFGGPTFYLNGVLNLTGLANVPYVRENYAWANWPLSDILMTFGLVGLIGNALMGYANVYKACLKQKRSVYRPLLGLIPFVVLTTANFSWMHGHHAQLLKHGSLYVPFMFYWGLSFAYLVGLVIISHVCRGPFPYWNWMYIPSILGAIDANLSQPILQGSLVSAQWTVIGAVLLAFLTYGYFVYDVITTITQETGKPCFTVVQHKHTN
ncbi:ethanolaminephosphotransferase [Malassezia yamatoensis]|uniref:Ethanolaminephosphotransferase n=1 Tax=Malassezia yamatoensis TaxID=253288 RepID=A0AAJ5YW05_9BASI|nr:ethanolaminephosphotransferase [Malassezia yamatoensis]